MRHEPLREAREQANVSLSHLAELLEEDKGNLSKAERGQASAHTIERLAGRYELALGIDRDSLVRQIGTLPASLAARIGADPGWMCLAPLTAISNALSRTFVPLFSRPVASAT